MESRKLPRDAIGVALVLAILLMIMGLLVSACDRSSQLVEAKVAFAWPELPYSLKISDKGSLAVAWEGLRCLLPGKDDATTTEADHTPPGEPAEPIYYHVSLRLVTGEEVTLGLTRDLRVTGDSGMDVLDSRLLHVLGPAIEQLRREAFGDLIRMEEIEEAIQADSRRVLRDLETGTSMVVACRPHKGSILAEPYTPDDAKALLGLYEGLLDWNWRPGVLTVGSRQVAVAFNKVGEGSDTIPDNDFPGPFDIKLFFSSGHNNLEIDNGQLIEILKANGGLVERLSEVTPYELAIVAMNALSHRDVPTLRSISAGPLPREEIEGFLDRVNDLDLSTITEIEAGETWVKVRLIAYVYMKNGGRGKRGTDLHFYRLDPGDGCPRWFVDLTGFLGLLHWQNLP